jgi:F-type H+-transporting ATPase subunit b
MLTFDITLIIQIIEALILTFILHVILIKPMMGYMRERESHFQALEKETQDFLKSAEDAINRYHEELAKARMEGVKKREMLKEEARKVEKELLTQAMKEAEEYKNRWAQEFSKELEKVRKELMEKIEFFASLIVERVLGRQV